MPGMRRREFVTLLGGAAAAWPLPARAQQASVPVVGSLNSVSPTEWAIYMTGFRKGLSQMGFGEGKNVSIEYRWAEGQYDRLPAMATDLIKRNVNVIFASGGPQVARAAKAATATVPIVFTVGNDPVGDGLVAGMNRPGGNATGVSHLAFALGEKRFELMTEMIPTARIFALVANPDTLPDQSESKEIQAAAIARGRTLHLLWARAENEIESVFAEIARQRPDAIIVSPDPFLNSRREQLIASAARLSIPAMYAWREYVDNDGLMSYG